MEKNGTINDHINFENLLKHGYAVIDSRFMQYEVCPPATSKYVIIKVSNRDTFYQEMFKQYFGIDVKEKDIYAIWQNILDHKLKMSNVLARDVSIKVAALDYYNIYGL
jgi:cytidylate kinase